MKVKKIGELDQAVELYDGCCFPIVQNDETKRVTFQKMREFMAQSEEMHDEFVAKETGKVLSSNDYTNDDKRKLAGMFEGAQPNVIEGIAVNGIPQPVVNKQVNLQISGGGSSMSYFKVTYDGTHIQHNGVNLTYQQLVDKYNDDEYFLFAEAYGLTMIPSLPPYEGDNILEFICVWIEGGLTTVSRLIINDQEQIKFEDIIVAKQSDIPSVEMQDNEQGGVDLTVDETTKTFATESEIVAMKNDLAIETKTISNLRYVRSGKIVNVYGDLSDLGTGTSINLGNCPFPCANTYAILNCVSKTTPFSSPVGSVWISGAGEVTLYKASSTNSMYVFGTYICK